MGMIGMWTKHRDWVWEAGRSEPSTSYEIRMCCNCKAGALCPSRHKKEVCDDFVRHIVKLS